MLEEWLAWRERTEEALVEERGELGLPEMSEEMAVLRMDDALDGEGRVVEEIFEEILEESEEVLE